MLKYVGKSFIVGVPARDLTDVEAALYGKARLLDSGLYVADSPYRKNTSKKNPIENVKHSDLESEEV